MGTRIVDVSGFDLATGHAAHGELRASAAVSLAATRSAFTAATVAAVATVSTSATSELNASATRSTTVTVTASATVAGPTNLSSSLVAGAGTYGPGSLTIPGYDQAYTVTVSDANIVGYHATTAPSPGIKVSLPEPSTPNASHWLTVRWVLSGRSRRVFHDIRTNWLTNGDVIEPDESVGADCVLTYTWDTTAHGWYVSSYTGDVQVREHGPDESTVDLPLFFTPEARALGTFSTIKAAQLTALESLPTLVPTYLASVGQFADVSSDTSGYILESLHAREIFDPTWQSGAFGFYSDPAVTAYPWVGSAVDGRTLLHEIGHAWDRHGLSGAGTPHGVDPVAGYSPNAYDEITYYDTINYFGIILVRQVYTFEPTRYQVVAYDADDTAYEFPWYERQPGHFQQEQPVVDLYATVSNKSGSYYRSTITEWVAQCFMLCWADHVPGYDSSAFDGLVTEIGGTTLANGQSILSDFRDYAVTVGALPSTW